MLKPQGKDGRSQTPAKQELLSFLLELIKTSQRGFVVFAVSSSPPPLHSSFSDPLFLLLLLLLPFILF